MDGSQLFFVFGHILGVTCGVLPPDSYLRDVLLKKSVFAWIWIPVLLIVVLWLFFLIIKGPGYAESDDSQISSSRQLFHCRFCNMDIPIRACHCKKCGKCILRKDHHCPWLGVCIGMDNHLFFVMMLLFEFILCGSLLLMSFHGMRDGLPLLEWLYRSAPCSISMGLSLLGFIQPLFLLPAHIYYILTNKTTWEVRKGREITYLSDWMFQQSPFSRGVVSNVMDFVTMRWKHPSYDVPQTEEEIDEWKEDNAIFENDCYRC